MDILFLLVPMSVVLAQLVIAVFAWALDGGQFDDLEGEAERILREESGRGSRVLDPDQAGKVVLPEKSPELPQ